MTAMLFCSDILDASRPHYLWEEEFKIAVNIGEAYLLDFEALLQNNVKKALRRLPTIKEPVRMIYHGWMVMPEIYQNLYLGLQDKGFQLINTLQEYLGCHYISGWYDVIKDFTPKTCFVEPTDPEKVLEVVRSFKSSVIIKDFVKSQKYHWREACFIPEGDNNVMEVINKFISLQKEMSVCDKSTIAIRKYVNLRKIGQYSKSDLPLSQEFRAFIYDGEVISLSEYWEEGEYFDDRPSVEFSKIIADLILKNIGSKFFTIDVAQKEDGDWICIEVGDGQVSSLPEKANKKEFYSRLMK